MSSAILGAVALLLLAVVVAVIWGACEGYFGCRRDGE